MKIVEIKPIPMAKAKERMIKREKQGEIGYEQKLALEHLKKFTKLTEKEAEELVKELSAVIKMSDETLISIVDILPKDADELRLLFSREKFNLKDEEINKILEIVKKYRK
ncbi:MAG: DNA-directed RNA polymerase subunit F [Candidatus Aenigmarchaeota archaeon]|nr:DNA-directed RNA polymerase subunit F [Candidatus Aenigmarchaeota archaeon]